MTSPEGHGATASPGAEGTMNSGYSDAAPDRMRAAFLMAQLRAAGLEVDQLIYSGAFLSSFSALSFPANGQDDAVTIWLCHSNADAVFWRDAAGDIHIDVTKMNRFAGAEHIYINIIVGQILAFHTRPSFVVDLGSVDLFLRAVTDEVTANATHQAIGLFSHFTKIHTGAELGTYCPFPHLSLASPPRLFPRPGLVELRAIRSVLQCQADLPEVCDRIIDNAQSDDFMYAPPLSQDANTLDLEHAVRHLITNAGMYGTSARLLESAIQEWIRRYMASLAAGEELFVNCGVTIQSHLTRTVALSQGLPFGTVRPGVKFGNIAEFYRLIAGQTVLMISPFALACAEQVASGRIGRMWKHIDVPDFRLVPLRAFVTTYPNQPHGSWSETFAHMCRQIDDIVAREKIDLVLGSCGCYGVPLMHHCYARHGLSAIYYGNLTNMLFGVRLNDFEAYFADANVDEWIDPFWGWDCDTPQNLQRIEGGRYLGMEPATKVPN